MFVLALFSTGWFSWTPEATGALAVALRVGAVAAVAVAVAGGVRTVRARGAGGVLDDRGAASGYWRVVAIEFALIVGGNVVLIVAGASAFVPVWVCAVVGLHFFALAPVLRAPMLRGLGVAVTAVAALGLALGVATDVTPSTVTGTGAGAALLGAAGLVLVGSSAAADRRRSPGPDRPGAGLPDGESG